jgi:hypothetical protein
VEDPKPGQHAGLDEALRRNLERMDADAAQPEAKP